MGFYPIKNLKFSSYLKFVKILFSWNGTTKLNSQFQLNALKFEEVVIKKPFNFEFCHHNKTKAFLYFSGWVGFRAMVYLALEVTWRDIASPVGASAASKRDAIRTVAPVARCGLIWRRRLTITETVRGKILVPFL